MIVKVVIPDALYNRVYFARGEQGPQGATGPQGPQGSQGPTGLTGPAGADGTSYTPGDPIYVTVRNSTGSPLLKGSIVYVSGSNGNHVQVSLAQAIGDITSARTIGWVADTIPNNTEGLIMVEGYLEGLNTSGLTAGSQLYLSPTVPGGFTATKPVAPDHMVYVGVAVKISAGDGHVYVKVQNGYELDELHDVKITSPVNNQVLTYDSATDLWVNATNPADGVTSITAASPLTGGTITSTGSIGLDQSLLTVTQSQVTGLVAELANDAKLNAANTFSVGGHNITSESAAVVPLLLKGASGQTADLMKFQSNAGVDVGRVDAAGRAIFGTVLAGALTSSVGAHIAAQTTSPTLIGAIIRGASGQTASLLQLQNSAGNITANFTAPVNNVNRLNLGGTDLGATLGISVHASGGVGQVIRGAAGQTSSLQEWQNSAGSVIAQVESTGTIRTTQQLALSGNIVALSTQNSGGIMTLARSTAVASNPGANFARLYLRDGTNAGTLKLVVRAGAAGAETTILDNIPQ